MANVYSKQSDIDQAILVWKYLVHNYPDDMDAREGLVKVYAEKGDTNEAIAGWKDLVEEHPQQCWLQNCLARAYLSNGRFDEAIAVWENAVANVPLGQGQGPVYNLAEVYLQHGYIYKAIAILKYHIN